MNKFELLFFVLIFSIQSSISFGQIVVTNIDTPEDLVTDVLVGGGVLISNIEFNQSLVYAGEVQAMVGYFDATGTDFPLLNGVLLATGNVNLAVGPNDDEGATDGTDVPSYLDWGGGFDDVDLTAIGTEEIFHEAIIEFDFVPEGDSVVFNYVFASEEYLEFVDAGFNDVFGFFISGPGFAGPYEFGGENIALIPGTTTPVSIDNLNDMDYPDLYVNNDGGIHVQYDGYTVKLTARAEVICGETYHIKLAIGDAGDEILDSGVFLEAGSFSSTGISIDIASVSGDDALVEGCDSALVSFIRPAAGDSVSLAIDYDLSGTAENGVDYTFLDGDIIFPSGIDTITFWIIPIDDGLVEGTETVTIMVELINDCGDTIVTEATIEIMDSSPYELTVSDTTFNCALDSVLIAFEILEGGVPEFEIIWDTGDTDYDAWVPGDIEGTITYTIDVIDACGTEATAEIDVTYAPLASPVITFDSEEYLICLGTDQVIDASFTEGGVDPIFSWSPTGETTEDITVTPSVDRWYYLTIDNSCSSTTDSVQVLVYEVSATAVIVDEICAGDCLGSINITASGGLAPYSYSIDGCATFGTASLIENLCAGDYSICIKDANDCQYTSTVTVGVGAGAADATITLVGPFCINSAATGLTAVTGGGIFAGDGITGSSFDPSIAGIGDHSIIYSVGAGDCSDADTIVITVNSLPTVSFIADTLQGCEPLLVTFTNTGDTGTVCYWNFGDGANSDVCSPVIHTYNHAGIYDISLSITDANNCTNTATKSPYIEVFQVPNASFVFSPLPASTLDPEIHFTDLSFAADSWKWDFDGLGNSIEENPVFVFPQEADHYNVQLIVKTVHGCIDSITKIVIVNEPVIVYVPNIFTPDGDTYNEVFLPYLDGIDVYDYHLTIFNRWGELMFESYDLTEGWNGTYGNQGLVQDGVYIWKIDVGDLATDKRLEFGGHVTVLK